MPRQEVCLIASDEEDEDGNLNKQTIIKSEMLPYGEVVYLPECPSNFRSEEEEEKVKTHLVPVVYVIKKSEFENNETNIQIKEKPNDIKFQDNKKNTCLTSCKSDDNHMNKLTVLNPAVKRGNKDESPRCVFNKKAKYERQATPLCDAIMREYSKRQKHLNHGAGPSQLSDIQIKDMLTKAKKDKVDCYQIKESMLNSDVISKEKPIFKIDSVKTISREVTFNMAESKKQGNTMKNIDPLKTSVRHAIEEVNIKPVNPVIDIDPQSPVNDLALPKIQTKTTKKLIDSSLIVPCVNETKQTVYDDNKKIPEQVRKKRGRKPKNSVVEEKKILPENTPRITRSAKKFIPKVRYQGDYNSDSDSSDDPTYVPQTEQTLTPLIQLSKQNKLPIIDINSKANSNLQCSELPKLKASVSSVPINKSFDLLSTSKTNLNTHERSLPKPEAVSLAIRLKLLVDKIADVLTSEASPDVLNDAQKLLQATQELFKLQPMRKSLPTESQIEREIKRSNGSTPRRADGSQFSNADFTNAGMRARDMSFHEKCNLVQDYFTSYKEVFNNHVVNSMIPVLSEVIMLCMEESAECLKRRKHGENAGCKEIVQQEISFYSKLMSNCSDKFFPWFDLIANKIIKTAASKSNMVTLISLMTGSLVIKASKYKTKLQEVREVLIEMSKAHNYTEPLLWQVLQTPEHVYQEEVELVVKMLKYFRQRQLLSLPVELVSNMEEAILGKNCVLNDIDPSRAAEICESSFTEQDQSVVNPSTNLSNIALQFVEALQTEQQCGSNRIEGKLDHILSVLSRNKDVQSDIRDTAVELFSQEREDNTCKNKSRNTLDSSAKQMLNNNFETEERGSMLAQLFESDQSGLDSLFSSYNQATKNNNVQVKTEPVDNLEESVFASSDSLESNNCVSVKQEPEEREHEELLPFATVWTDPPELNNISLSCTAVQDICEIEDNSIFKQEPSTF